MRHDQGGLVRLARESTPGTETIIRTPVRPVPGHTARGNEGERSRPRRPVRRRQSLALRRREQWSPLAAVCLSAELVAAVSVAGWGFVSGHGALVAVALGWATVQAGGTALGRCQRRLWSLRGTLARIQGAAVVMLGLVAGGLLAPTEAAWFLGLGALSVGLRGCAVLGQRRAEPLARTMVVGRGQDLPAVVVSIAADGSEVSTYSVNDTDELTRGEHLHRAIIESAPDRVVVVSGTLDSRELQELSWAVEELDLDVVVGMNDVGLSPSRLEPVMERGVHGVRVVPRRGLLGERALGLAHRVAAGSLLIVLAPVMLGLAMLVRMDSRGPALFVQNRVGRRGREFPMFKFRTMHTDAEQMLDSLADQNESEGGVLFKMKHDPRITRLGRILRATSLDELPQLINVVRGEMSLIGPRPALPREVAEYDHRARRRLAVRPGLTGLWQVSGRSNLSFEDAVRLDIEYIDNWSLRQEVEIAFRTVGAVVRREGAY